MFGFSRNTWIDLRQVMRDNYNRASTWTHLREEYQNTCNLNLTSLIYHSFFFTKPANTSGLLYNVFIALDWFSNSIKKHVAGTRDTEMMVSGEAVWFSLEYWVITRWYIFLGGAWKEGSFKKYILLLVFSWSCKLHPEEALWLKWGEYVSVLEASELSSTFTA